MNKVHIGYAYPTSDIARKLGKVTEGCYFVSVGRSDCTGLIISPPFHYLTSAEGFCNNHGLKHEQHSFPADRDNE